MDGPRRSRVRGKMRHMARVKAGKRAGASSIDGFRPGGLEATDVRLDGRTLVIVSYAHAAPSALPSWDTLTPSERDVLRLVLAGYSNAQIAKARGTSFGTVAKQVSAIYRRVGVGSRRELATRWARAR
jgi:DNA-binding NarL/FixJ family response regulator